MPSRINEKMPPPMPIIVKFSNTRDKEKIISFEITPFRLPLKEKIIKRSFQRKKSSNTKEIMIRMYNWKLGEGKTWDLNIS